MDKKFETTLAGARIKVTRTGDFDDELRRNYRWRITLEDGRKFKARDLWTGARDFGDRGAKAMTGTLLSLLGAFAEAQRYEHSENRNLFPKGLREWATQNSDEIAMLQLEIDLDTRARELGAERGKAAASWTFDGNTSAETYRTFLRMHEDGDPAIEQFDTMTGWLSGEYAGEPSPTTLAHDLDLDLDDHDAIDAACEAYEEAADEAYWDELVRVARLQTEDEQ